MLGRGNFSTLNVVETLEKTFTQVHVTDGINAFRELNGTRELSVSVAPVVFNTFHVPLIDNDDNFLALGTVNLFKKVLVLLINKDFLEVREESGSSLSEPINLMLVQAFLSKCSRSDQRDLVTVVNALIYPLRIAPLESLHEIVKSIGSCLVSKSMSGPGVKFTTHKVDFGTNLLCSFTGILHFETRSFKSKIVTESEEVSEKTSVHTPSEDLEPASGRGIDVTFGLSKVAIESGLIFVHLILGVNKFQETCIVPPLLAGLDDHSVGLQFLNQLLSSVGEHSALVASSNEVDILSVEAFTQLN